MGVVPEASGVEGQGDPEGPVAKILKTFIFF